MSGLAEIRDFALAHPAEVILLDFSNGRSFVAPGDASDPVIDIPPSRLDDLADVLLEYLGGVLVNGTQLTSRNPTVGDVLSTGRNVLALIKNDYLLEKSDYFIDDIIVQVFEGFENTEDLFNQRSQLLQDYQMMNRENVTMVQQQSVLACNVT